MNKCLILPTFGIIVAIIVALLIPFCTRHIEAARRTSCACNLRHLFELGCVYAATHGKQWPSHRGDHLWIAFTTTVPPLLAEDSYGTLACPSRGEELIAGQTDYRGPLDAATLLKPEAFLGADKIGNHGHDEGGNLMLKSGNVLYYGKQDPQWQACALKLVP